MRGAALAESKVIAEFLFMTWQMGRIQRATREPDSSLEAQNASAQPREFACQRRAGKTPRWLYDNDRGTTARPMARTLSHRKNKRSDVISNL